MHSFPDEIKEGDPFHPRFSSFEDALVLFFPFLLSALGKGTANARGGPRSTRARCSISEIISFPGKPRPPFRPSKRGVPRAPCAYIERSQDRVTFSSIPTLNGSLFAPLYAGDSECRPFYFDSASTRESSGGPSGPRDARRVGFVNGLLASASPEKREMKLPAGSRRSAESLCTHCLPVNFFPSPFHRFFLYLSVVSLSGRLRRLDDSSSSRASSRPIVFIPFLSIASRSSGMPP